MRLRPAFLVLLALSACVSAPKDSAPPPQPAPVPPVKTAPPPIAAGPDWRDWPVTRGDWAYRQDARGSLALFGQSSLNADFLIRCDKSSRKIYLSRIGSFPDGESGRMTIRATTGLQTYSVSNASGTPPYVAAELVATDPHLDAITFSRGRFLVSVKGTADLVIPAWPEFGRVVEDCRG
jgi:hypothetical protein